MNTLHIVLIDCSGSVVHSQFEQHFQRLLRAKLQTFSEDDVMEVIYFASSYKPLFGKPVPCVEILKQLVLNKTEESFFNQPASTDLRRALNYAFSIVPPANYAVDIQILTDGQIT